MAESKIPATFKALTPFIRRAEELERDSTRPESKLIAYYCRQYAMEMGIKLRENDSSNDATNFLLSLMDRLEDDKQKLPAFTQDEGKEICEDFALEIFAKADDEDRAGCADKSTARTFYAAGTFFDILNQFGEPSEDILEKRKYCKYKAATILKAIKEGTPPVPGPPGVGYATGEGLPDEQPMKQEAPSLASSSSFSSLPSTPSFPSPPVTAPSPPTPQPVKSEPPAFPSFTSSSSSFGPSGVNNWSPPPAASAPPPEPKYTPPPPAYTPPAPQPMYAPPAPTSHPVMPPAPASYAPQTLSARNASKPVSQDEINDAMECAKFAVAALKVKDIELAIQRLEMALRAIK